MALTVGTEVFMLYTKLTEFEMQYQEVNFCFRVVYLDSGFHFLMQSK